ncbi:MAG: DUF423 domain-containing protein [Rhodospirillales bacterium]|nr:DUF423 domain-containing protein [Alphaproteobacteria bacterium]MCB9977473.1 DUF423 domain-containing protein [Rhodospirillales bacterium]
MARFILLFGAILGLGGVIAGALFDHALSDEMTHSAETALRYHQGYALLITALGLVMTYAEINPRELKRLALTSTLFIVGTILFCGSLYVLSFTGIRLAAYGAPAGGLTLMAGWAALCITALLRR